LGFRGICKQDGKMPSSQYPSISCRSRRGLRQSDISGVHWGMSPLSSIKFRQTHLQNAYGSISTILAGKRVTANGLELRSDNESGLAQAIADVTGLCVNENDRCCKSCFIQALTSRKSKDTDSGNALICIPARLA
jgi:hypothetical protein